MANRYWVGGTGNINDTNKWSTTSGGSGGASVPTSSDAAFFDSNSGGGTCTVNATFTCASLDFTGYTGDFDGTDDKFVNVYGALTLEGAATYSYLGTLRLRGTGTYNLTTDGATLNCYLQILETGATSTYNLQGNLIIVGETFQMMSGTFSTNNYDITAGAVNFSSTYSKTVNMGSSNVTCTDFGFAVVLDSTDLTFNEGTAIFKLTSSSSQIVSLQDKTIYEIYSQNTFGDGITITSISGGKVTTLRADSGLNIEIEDNDTVIIDNLLIDGCTLESDLSGTAGTISSSNALTMTGGSIKDITFTGTGSFTATDSTDGGGNTNITFVSTSIANPLFSFGGI